MTYDFMLYTGKINPVNDPTIPDLGESWNVVLHLSQSLPSNSNYYLYFDNWFTSLPLLSHLATKGNWCCGTVREARLSGIKKGKNDDKELMKKGRGAYKELKSTNEVPEITYVKWNGNKIVNIVSTFAKAHPVENVSRYDKKVSQRIFCPNIVQKYNKSMGGVDLFDCLISLYKIEIGSKKYYHRLVRHMVVVKSWLLYKGDALHLQLKKIRSNPLGIFQDRGNLFLDNGRKRVLSQKRKTIFFWCSYSDNQASRSWKATSDLAWSTYQVWQCWSLACCRGTEKDV